MSAQSGDRPPGVWKSGQGKGRRTPRGRQLDDAAWKEIRGLLGDRPRRRDLLIEHLHRIQDTFGALSAAHLRALAEEMRLSEAEIMEVASFYAHFDIVKEGGTPPTPLTVRVCDSLTCEMMGAATLMKALEENTDGAKVRVLRAPCMGRCGAAPVVAVGHRHVDRADPASVERAIAHGEAGPVIPDYEGLDAYCAGGGYTRLRAMREGRLTADALQGALLEAGLRGCGGAGFPTGKKWAFVRAEPAPRYLAVNGDEGEPGTFKDRHLLESVPHLVCEGMLLAAEATGAARIYFYLRDEYPAARAILSREIAKLEKAGIAPPGFIDLRRGAGSYICGEESAMIESIEGKRGLPRHRPPFVAQKGIFARPTLVNNVETLYWVARIAREGSGILANVQRNGRKGLRHYSVSGRVRNPGIYLLPSGSSIRDVIDAAGGMAEGHIFMAYQPGGPSSGLLPASLDDVPLDFDMLQPHGSFIGSAAIVVLSTQDSIRAAALNMLRFFEDESCGQCTPCRVGCEKAVRLMERETWDVSLLEELCGTMEDASICGLGQAAPNAIRLTIRHFPQEVS